MDEHVLESLVGSPPNWMQRPRSPEESPILCCKDAVSYAAPREKPDPGLLLDKWLADQECLARGHINEMSCSGLTTSKKSSSMVGIELKPNTGVNRGKPDPIANHRHQNAHPADGTGNLRDFGLPSSSAGWKIQFFKAAVAIRKKREEYETRRRRSVLSLMKCAAQGCSHHASANRSDVMMEEQVLQAETQGAVGVHIPDGKSRTASPYKWSWKSCDFPSFSPSQKTVNLLSSSTCNHGRRHPRWKSNSVFRHLLRLHQKQLLASHRARLLPSHLQVESLLGEGASGRVWRVRHRRSGKLFALKVVDKGDCTPTSISCSRMFVERHVLICSGRSRHLVKLHAAFQDEKRIFLLQELLPGPSLYSLIKSRGRLPEAQTRRYAAQLALAVHALHKIGFIHRDIKPENVILDKNGDVKLIDMGLASRPASSVSYSFSGSDSAKAHIPRENRAHSPASSSANRGGHISTSAIYQEDKALKESAENTEGEKRGAYTCNSIVRPFPAVKASRGASRVPSVTPNALLESFGSWRLQHFPNRDARSCVGTLHYMAPEVAVKHHAKKPSQCLSEPYDEVKEVHDIPATCISPVDRVYSKKADWWSFGAVLFECLFGHPPFGRFHLVANETPIALSKEKHITSSNSLDGRNVSRPEDMFPEQAIQRVVTRNAGKQESMPLSCGVVSNPELLLCTTRNWRRYLEIPPSPFVARQRRDADATAREGTDSPETPTPEVSTEAVDLLRHLLCEEKSRYGFTRIKHHPWFSSLDWKSAVRTREVSTIRVKKKGLLTSIGDNRKCATARTSFPAVSDNSARRHCIHSSAEDGFSGLAGKRLHKSVFAATREEKGLQPKTYRESCTEGTCSSPGCSYRPLHRGQGRVQGGILQTDSPLGKPAVPFSRSESTDADASCHQFTAEGVKFCSDSEEEGPEWNDAEKLPKSPICSWSEIQRDSLQLNRWLLDMRFLGFEYDCRRQQEAEAVQHLCRAFYDPASQSDCTLEQASGIGEDEEEL